MKNLGLSVFLLISTFSLPAIADTPCVPPEGGKCLNYIQFESVKKALKELDDIKKSPAIVTTSDQIAIIRDWDGRVYINGGESNPLRFNLKLGETIDRDMAVILPTQIYYRPKPPDPMFRLRIRAQFGLLAFNITDSLKDDKTKFMDAGVGWDFFHYKDLNVSAYTGLRSFGAGVGLDLTKNFGPYVGYSMVYDGLKSNAFLGVYFSLNLSDKQTRCKFRHSVRKR